MNKQTVVHETSEIKMTRSEYSKLGALALNGNPEKKKAAILKGLETRKRNRLRMKLAEFHEEPMASNIVREPVINDADCVATFPIVTEWEKLLINKKDNR